MGDPRVIHNAETESRDRVGFTGTREGMTLAQYATVLDWLEENQPTEVHHGDCVGADLDFDNIARDLGLSVAVHPPADPKLRAFCDRTNVWPAKPYLDRNRDIVNACGVLIATPKEDEAQDKGGTWYTVRYAKDHGKRVIIVWPDGTVYDPLGIDGTPE